MSALPGERRRWIYRLIAIGTGLLAMYGLIAAVSFTFRSQAGPEDLPTIEARASGLVAAIDRFILDDGRPPLRLEELLPKYLGEIPKPLPDSEAEFSYLMFPFGGLKEGEWRLTFHCGPFMDIDSGEAIVFLSKDHRWYYYPD